MQTKNLTAAKTRKSHKPVYPEYLSLEVLDQVISSGKDPMTMLAEMKKALLERVLEAELNMHLTHEKHAHSQDGNYRNGHSKKTVLLDDGSIEIATPRDRKGEFEPILIPKRERHFKGFDDKIISMYGMGMSTRDIASHLQEMYSVEVSHELIANATEGVLEEVRAWQTRPLEAVYSIVYLDAMVVKVRHEKQVLNKSLYMAMGINMEGRKEILGMWLGSGGEGSKFWLSILNELKNRGIKDILIACCDGLTGFPEAINAVFPDTVVQLCIVHMIRNSLKFVSYKDYKALAVDLKPIYTAVNEDQALEALTSFQGKWDSKYPMIAESWKRHWQEIIPFLQYPEYIRKAIYTTNIIEASNRQVRKVIKTKGAFPSDDAVYKIVYLALKGAQKKWTMPIRDWHLALSQFYIYFPGRVKA